MVVNKAATKYVAVNAKKGLALSGVDFWHILYTTFEAIIKAIEKTYINM